MGQLLPREKFEKRGLQALTDRDLLAVILNCGTDGCDVFEVSRLVSRKLSGASDSIVEWKSLMEIRGIGKVRAMVIAAALELGRRFWCRDETRVVIRARADVLKEMSYLKDRRQEHVVVIYLNARNEIMKKESIAIGSKNLAVVETRSVFEPAIRLGASGIILVHNHPSGNREPSEADLKFTERVKKAGELLGIELVDHVII